MTPLTITVDDTANPMLKVVFVSTYGLVAEITLERGAWRLNWIAAAALLTASDHLVVAGQLKAMIDEMNVLRNITRRLKS